MRTTPSSLLLVALGLGLVASFRLQSPVQACSIGSYQSPEAQKAALLDSLVGSDLIVVGTVLDERRVGRMQNNEVFKSTIRPDAVLLGDATGGSLSVGQLEYENSFCSGGPRLLEGERVLLALDRAFIESAGGAIEADVWRVHHFLGKVRLDEGEAVSQYANVSRGIGTPGDLIRHVGEAVSASTDRVEEAVDAFRAYDSFQSDEPGRREPAEAEPSTGDSDGIPSEIAWVAGILAVLMVMVVAVARSRSHEGERPGSA
jgi:hypothetical protein